MLVQEDVQAQFGLQRVQVAEAVGVAACVEVVDEFTHGWHQLKEVFEVGIINHLRLQLLAIECCQSTEATKHGDILGSKNIRKLIVHIVSCLQEILCSHFVKTRVKTGKTAAEFEFGYDKLVLGFCRFSFGNVCMYMGKVRGLDAHLDDIEAHRNDMMRCGAVITCANVRLHGLIQIAAVIFKVPQVSPPDSCAFLDQVVAESANVFVESSLVQLSLLINRLNPRLVDHKIFVFMAFTELLCN
mmetsp:Transcript_22141/g.55565  ORF Transcript_22141/g.55565 Transcript_22141/m.55565 type:complete len:243 (+) Transcript_22141:413-1141(+)